jgi:hypothetical protein
MDIMVATATKINDLRLSVKKFTCSGVLIGPFATSSTNDRVVPFCVSGPHGNVQQFKLEIWPYADHHKGFWANTCNKFDPTSPFGGYKESGFGREGGRHGLLPYVSLS